MIVMLEGDESLPDKVEIEVGPLISELGAAGWTVFSSRYDAHFFGNWYVDLRRADLAIRLIKDKSQYMIDGPSSDEMKAAGLWKAFDDLEEFRHAVAKWAINPDVSIGNTNSSN